MGERERFPALAGSEVFFDGPGGSQTPAEVIDALLAHPTADERTADTRAPAPLVGVRERVATFDADIQRIGQSGKAYIQFPAPLPAGELVQGSDVFGPVPRILAAVASGPAARVSGASRRLGPGIAVVQARL